MQLLQLLLKASQDKKFVCEEAEKAMRAMAASMPPLPLLKKLKAYVRHANLRVRAKAAVAIAHCVTRMVRTARIIPGPLVRSQNPKYLNPF
jgi:hypothetical protein